MRYRAAPSGERIARQLGPIVALYHRPSGQTHLLAQPLPELLAALDDGETDADALLERLEIVADAESRAAVSERLAEIIAIGLVEAL